MKKITQGNWEVSGTTKGLNGLYIKADNQNIAQVFSSIPECEQNAKLIAAAPELLKALEDCLFGLEIANKDNPNKGFKLSIEKAKAAINKATK